MPELPEVRAHAERLDADFAGAVLAGFRPLSFTVLKTFDPRPDDAVGQPVTAVRSRAKYLMLEVGELTFVVHLMQGGRLRPDDKQARKPRGGLARWTFEDGRALLLTEPGTEHRAGIWVVRGDPLDQAPIADIGPEATELSTTELHELFGAHNMRLHGFLRDQRILSGLGRRLGNEICHRARLSPFAMTARLDVDAADAVRYAIAEVVAEGLEFDRGREEMTRSAERPSRVHGRAGAPCPVCGDVVRAVEYRAYTVNYCATCQTDGRVLADNTTSKFLK